MGIMEKDFNYLHLLNVGEWYKMKIFLPLLTFYQHVKNSNTKYVLRDMYHCVVSGSCQSIIYKI